MAEYVKLLNGRYITNALVSSAERRERKHVEFGLYGVNLLNKEVAKSSNLVVKLRILHHVLSPKQSLSGQEQFPLIIAVFFYKIFEKKFTCFIHRIVSVVINSFVCKEIYLQTNAPPSPLRPAPLSSSLLNIIVESRYWGPSWDGLCNEWCIPVQGRRKSGIIARHKIIHCVRGICT